MSNINDIQEKLQQLQDLDGAGNANKYQFTLQLLYADVYAFNKKNDQALRFQLSTNPGGKVYAQYSTFPNQLSEQLKKLG